jgi:hypothetical protein
MTTPLYGPLSPAESAVRRPKPLLPGQRINRVRFEEAHPYRVVGPENMPERRFATLVCAARTAASAGPPFHVECREFRASYAECCRLANNADFDRQVQEAREETKYWEKIKETK